MEWIKIILGLGIMLLTGYLLLASLYLFVLSFFGTLYRSSNAKSPVPPHRLVILVPAYKNDIVLLQSCTRNLELLRQIPDLSFDYIILGDHLKKETADQLPSKAEVFTIDLEKSTKSRAINQWIADNKIDYSHALVLDVDNLLTTRDLKEGLFFALSNAVHWTQFKRIAANEGTEISGLDAWSELVNNHIFRRGASALGIFPALIGSGMVAPFPSFRNIHTQIDVTGGFDKWVEHYLLQDGIKVFYLDHVWIKDQKIADLSALKTQRTRWVAAQFLIAKQLFWTFLKTIVLFKWRSTTKYIQLYLPPRVLHLATSILVIPLVYLAFPNLVQIALVNLFLLGAALLIATPFNSWLNILKLMFKNGFKLVFHYLSFFKGFNKANKEFIATEHKTQDDSD